MRPAKQIPVFESGWILRCDSVPLAESQVLTVGPPEVYKQRLYCVGETQLPAVSALQRSKFPGKEEDTLLYSTLLFNNNSLSFLHNCHLWLVC